jgi:hypothetical protein
VKILPGEGLVEELHGMKDGNPVLLAHVAADRHPASGAPGNDTAGARLADVPDFFFRDPF